MYKLYFSLFLVCSGIHVFAQDSTFINTGDLHNGPYGAKSWDWDTAAYKQFSYTSPADGYKMLYRLLGPQTVDSSAIYPLFILLHGAGEGIGAGCEDTMPANTCQLTWGARLLLDSIGKYPSYVFFPAQTGGGGYWASSNINNSYMGYKDPMLNHTRVVFEVIDSVLKKNYHVDPDRIYLTGVASGADAVWDLVERRPDLFAAVSPLEGMGDVGMAKVLVNHPIWMFQSGQDNNPAPAQTEAMYDSLVQQGGKPKRSLYMDRYIWSWIDAFQSNNWLKWLYAQDKKNILIHDRKSSVICLGDTLTLGVPYGFAAYKWSKDGQVIAGATGFNYKTSVAGTYTASFQRIDSSWASSYPVTLTQSNVPCVPVLGVTEPQDQNLTKVLERILTTMGQQVEEANAQNGVYIYQYKDGTRQKVVR